jgi:hypothetical protein
MNKGALIFAHNSREIDYILLSTIAGGLAKKNLNIPITLVTDESSVDWAKESEIYSFVETVFENVIIVDKPSDKNFRNLKDGATSKHVPFINSNRYSAYDLSPYYTTLLIDSDFLIFTDHLSNYWDLDYDIMIGKSMNDIIGNRSEDLDKRVSEVGPHMYWATTVMFKKNKTSKIFFNLVSFIKENYNYFADLYRFDPRQYRNDISFSIAMHILNGFEENTIQSLPDITTVLDSDVLEKINVDSSLKILASDKIDPQKYFMSSIRNKDLHILNKQSIIRLKDELLKLI